MSTSTSRALNLTFAQDRCSFQAVIPPQRAGKGAGWELARSCAKTNAGIWKSVPPRWPYKANNIASNRFAYDGPVAASKLVSSATFDGYGNITQQ